MYVRKSMFIFIFFILTGCGISKVTTQIPDYILQPNGKEIIGNKGLTAFIFENNPTIIPIEQYLSAKFKTDNYTAKEFWVVIDKNKYKLIVYDYDEFEKYFGSSNYSAINEFPDIVKKGDQRKFIAISMINFYNDDCLAEGSLYQNIAVNYLKKLKDEYYNQ
jgi:hypothetical protein